jgi:tight adherence protein C
MNFEEFLPPGVTPEDVLVLMSALSALSVTVTVWFALLHRDPAMKRARLMARERKTMRAGIMGARRRNERLPTISMMRQIVDRLNLLRSSQADKISQKLMRAGWRSKDAIIRYLFFKLALPFAFAGVALSFVYGADLYGLSPAMKLVVTIVSVLVGAYVPDMIVKNAALKRRDKIRKSLPDGLDLMVICAEAGLSLDATLMRVSQEMEQAAPELADELSLTGLELGFLTDRRKALKNLALRVDLLAVRGVVNTLLQAERYGTPLAQSLRVMSAESRQERVMKAEEKAARLPAMLTVPMMVFILPPLFIVLIGAAILDVIDGFSSL